MSQQNYKTTGIVHAILPKEQRGQYTIAKIVLEVDGYQERKEYPCFECFGKKADLVDPFKEGDGCEIEWNLSGRENKGKYYSTLSAWKIVKSGATGEYHHGTDKVTRPPSREHPTAEHERRKRDVDSDIEF